MSEYENMDLGYNRKTKTWEVIPVCEDCGKPLPKLCFEGKDDYDFNKTIPMKCTRCMVKEDLPYMKKDKEYKGMSEEEMLDIAEDSVEVDWSPSEIGAEWYGI